VGYLGLLSYKEKLLLAVSYLPWKFQKFCPGYLREMKDVSLKAKTVGFQIETEDGLVRFNRKGEKYYLRKGSTDFLVFEQVILNKEYSEIVNYIDAIGKTSSIKTIIDAGANAGYTSRFLSKSFFGSKILAIEPDKGNLDVLRKNVLLDETTKVEILEGGFWFEDSYLKIDHSFRDGREWSLTLFTAEKNEVDAIPCYGLKSAISKLGVTEIDLLKIDIEGGEQPIFENWAKNSNDLLLVKNIAIEIHDEVANRLMICDVLKEAGFKLKEIGETTFGFR
jgi:FkbM family methyltransferase